MKIVNARGATTTDTLAFDGKIAAFYFAAEWCPDCRAFQPLLNAFYEQINKTKHQFEIIFVGSDRSEAEQNEHFNTVQGPWWMLPYHAPDRKELKKKYKVCAKAEQDHVGITDRESEIPCLIVVKCTGEVLDRNGVQTLEKFENDAFAAWNKI